MAAEAAESARKAAAETAEDLRMELANQAEASKKSIDEETKMRQEAEETAKDAISRAVDAEASTCDKAIALRAAEENFAITIKCLKIELTQAAEAAMKIADEERKRRQIADAKANEMLRLATDSEARAREEILNRQKAEAEAEAMRRGSAKSLASLEAAAKAAEAKASELRRQAALAGDRAKSVMRCGGDPEVVHLPVVCPRCYFHSVAPRLLVYNA